ncbi:MAG: PqqD family protein [Gemmatimonadetes bacterium]|nr:PqqD family protein [Gemmatimonadota bacterium]
MIFRQLSDDWVVFDPVANQIHVLNLSAALVWASCDGTRPVEEIVRDVAASYDDTVEDSVRSDVESALERFGSEGLLA